jgi:hypothetical protein
MLPVNAVLQFTDESDAGDAVPVMRSPTVAVTTNGQVVGRLGVSVRETLELLTLPLNVPSLSLLGLPGTVDAHMPVRTEPDWEMVS